METPVQHQSCLSRQKAAMNHKIPSKFSTVVDPKHGKYGCGRSWDLGVNTDLSASNLHITISYARPLEWENEEDRLYIIYMVRTEIDFKMKKVQYFLGWYILKHSYSGLI